LTRSRIVEVITQGSGLMFPFAERVPPQDRWAIASYVKALQLSQSAPLDRLPEDLRRQVGQ
jgi:mono/diheme cytochrome c family protein